MSVLHKLPLRIAFAAALCVAACGDDDTSSAEGSSSGEDAGQAGHGASGGHGGQGGQGGRGGHGGQGGSGGKAAAAGNGGIGGKLAAAGDDGSGGKGGKGGKGGSTANGGHGGSSNISGGATHDSDAGIDLEDAGAAALPQAYNITFSTTECFGRCPVYSVSLDQDGNVAFDGQADVAQAGKSTKQVAPNAAADVYEALLAAGYFDFKDAYRTEQDGCARVRTDSPTHNWSVEHDGQTKKLSHYLGCEGVPGLDKVEAVSKLLIEKSAIADWIGSNN